jgi:Kef-type K+ transport system membrane component KefB/CBS domain-containing protein
MLSILYLGTLMLFCLFMGRLVSHMRVPKVIGYLLSGILLGPSMIGVFSEPLSERIYLSINQLSFASELALGLIAFNIGGEFQSERLKRIGKKIVIISLSETFITFSIVCGALFMFNVNISAAICLGILATATAPAATLLVLREYNSEGVVTNSLLILTGLNNFICLTLFTLFFPALVVLPQGGPLALLIGKLVASLGGLLSSLAVGFILGLLLSIFEKRITKPVELILLVMATIIIGIGYAKMISASPLLVSLIIGVTVINLAKRGSKVFEEIKKVDLPLYAAFFALSGANLHWELLSTVGGIGVVYVVGRVVGKIVGVACGAKQTQAGYNLKKYGGCGLLAQAGVALGLALLVQEKDPKLGEIVSTTIFSTVIIFETLGPLAVRWSIVQSGEVKIFNLIHRDEGIPFRESLREIVFRLRYALGFPVWKSKQSANEILVEHVMRTQSEVIHEDTHFDQILKVIEHSRYNRFPVVNEREELTGMISFQDIRDVIYDGVMKDLIIAKDIATPAGLYIHSKTTINEALDIFEKEKIDLLPVIDDQKSKHLLGILTQRDVLAVFKEKVKDS